MKNKNIYFYSLIICIISVSFFFHSSLFSPILNSDDAIVILMIHDFHLPQDLYYWGANRFGSLIPLIGQIFYKIFNFSPILSESLSHYSMLILGFLGFSSLFKSKFYKIIFALIWFLPPLRMIDILKLSQGEQYCLIGISVFILNKIYGTSFIKYKFFDYFLLSLLLITYVFSIWVSDLAIPTVFIIISINLFFYYKRNKNNFISKIFKAPELFFFILGIFLCTVFIMYAKNHAIKEENYYNFFNVNIIYQSLIMFLKSLYDIISFSADEFFTSLYFYLLICIILILFYIEHYRHAVFEINNKKWFYIFLIDLILIFILLISSEWVYKNNVARRYFVCNYISFWILFLIFIDSFHQFKLKKIINYLLLLTVLIGGFGTIYNFKYVWPKTLTPKIKIVDEFKMLGKVGIISEYWNSYITSCPNPDLIVATPHEKSAVRNKKIAEKVFQQEKIFIIKDMWLDSFPDSLTQFGHILIKDGVKFRIGDCDVCKYNLCPH